MTNQSRAQQRWLSLCIAEWIHEGDRIICILRFDAYVHPWGRDFCQCIYV